MANAVLVKDSLLDDLGLYLQSRGAVVDSTKKDYRVMMFSKDHSRHTQGYSNDSNIYIKFTGPETDMVQDFIDKRNEEDSEAKL